MNTTTLKIAIEVDDKGSVKIRQVGEEAAAAGRKGGRGFKDMQQAAAGAEKQTALLASAAKSMGAALAGALTVRTLAQLTGLADAYTRAEGRLRLVTESATELQSVQDDLFASSQRSRSAFLDNVETYARLAQNTRELNLAQGDLVTINETLNKAFVVSGATASERAGTMIQLSQAFSMGHLRGQEFNSVAEQGSRILQMLADYLGVTRGELRAMAEEGQLTADVLTKAILAGAEDVNQEFEKMPTTVGEAGTMLKNVLADLVNDANRATGATDDIASAIKGIAVAIQENKDGIFAFFRGLMTSAAAASEGAAMMAEAGAASVDRVITATVSKVPKIKSAIKDLQGEITRVNDEVALRRSRGADVGYELHQINLLEGKLKHQQTLLKNITSSPYVTGEAGGKINVVTEAFRKQTFVLQGVKNASETTHRLNTKQLQELKESYLPVEQAQKKFAAAEQSINKALWSGQITQAQANEAKAEAKKQLDRVTGATAGRGRALRDQAAAEKEAARAMQEREREITATLDRLLPLRKAEQDFAASTEHLKVALASGTISLEEYQTAVGNLGREMEEAQKRAGQYAREQEAAARAAKESELTLRGLKVDTAIAQGQLSRSDALPFQIGLLKERLDLLTEHLQTLQKNTPEEIVAWNSQSEAIARTNLELVELEQQLRLQDGWEAARQGFRDYADEAMNSGGEIQNAMKKVMASMTEALTQFVTTGKLEFSSLVESIIADLARIAIQRAIIGPLASGLESALGDLGGGVMGLFGGYHSGGSIGVDAPTFTRTVPLTTFAGAPRFHTGLKGNEFPAILERGESVLTEGQMAAIGKGLSDTARSPQVNVTVNNAPAGTTVESRESDDGMTIDVIVEMVSNRMQNRIDRGYQPVRGKEAWL
jgi:tape measure domain-containing protein